jgi:hypothetical protein
MRIYAGTEGVLGRSEGYVWWDYFVLASEKGNKGDTADFPL